MHSQMDSHFGGSSLEFSKSDFRGQNSLNWKLPYIIKNLLRHRCTKWAHMIQLSIYSTSYGQKKGQESRCHFDFQPLKVWNRHEIHAFTWRATYFWKALNKGYNFSFDPISIRGLQEIMGLQMGKSFSFEILGIPDLGIPGKVIFRCRPPD
jgi:hypothetical protein